MPLDRSAGWGGVAMRWIVLLMVGLAAGSAGAQREIDELTGSDEPPAGVVFEIVEGDEDALAWALPLVSQFSERLRQRFPGLPIAVVTHGSEQFGLLASRTDVPFDTIHEEALLLHGQQVDLHVCGVHAGWYGNDEADFPAYVDFAVSGPARIRDYENFGYVLVPIREPDD